jgi:hypothetical protein
LVPRGRSPSRRQALRQSAAARREALRQLDRRREGLDVPSRPRSRRYGPRDAPERDLRPDARTRPRFARGCRRERRVRGLPARPHGAAAAGGRNPRDRGDRWERGLRRVGRDAAAVALREAGRAAHGRGGLRGLGGGSVHRRGCDPDRERRRPGDSGLPARPGFHVSISSSSAGSGP